MNYDQAYEQVRTLVREHSYDRYVIILMQPRRVRSFLMSLTAFHMELQACCRYHATPAVLAMRLQWWFDQLKVLLDVQPSHYVLVALRKYVEAEVCSIEDLLYCVEGFQSLFDAVHKDKDFPQKISLVLKPYGVLWAKAFYPHNVSYNSDTQDIILKCLMHWLGYKIARGCDKNYSPYAYYFSEIDLGADSCKNKSKCDCFSKKIEYSILQRLEKEKFEIHFSVTKMRRKVSFSQREYIKPFFLFGVMGDFYKELLLSERPCVYRSLTFWKYVLFNFFCFFSFIK